MAAGVRVSAIGRLVAGLARGRSSWFLGQWRCMVWGQGAAIWWSGFGINPNLSELVMRLDGRVCGGRVCGGGDAALEGAQQVCGGGGASGWGKQNLMCGGGAVPEGAQQVCGGGGVPEGTQQVCGGLGV